MTMQGRAERFSQVHKHKHMCLCIDVCSDLQVCDTVQPAEPLLAKAAFNIAKYNQLDHVMCHDTHTHHSILYLITVLTI